MMKNITFTDWQGRLTTLYNLDGTALQFFFRECASLLAGVRQDGSPAAVQNPLNIDRVNNLLHPDGVSAKELALQEQRIFGNHGTYCTNAGIYSFALCDDEMYLPTTFLQVIAVHVPPILAAIGRVFDVHNPSQ